MSATAPTPAEPRLKIEHCLGKGRHRALVGWTTGQVDLVVKVGTHSLPFEILRVRRGDVENHFKVPEKDCSGFFLQITLPDGETDKWSLEASSPKTAWRLSQVMDSFESGNALGKVLAEYASKGANISRFEQKAIFNGADYHFTHDVETRIEGNLEFAHVDTAGRALFNGWLTDCEHHHLAISCNGTLHSTKGFYRYRRDDAPVGYFPEYESQTDLAGFLGYMDFKVPLSKGAALHWVVLDEKNRTVTRVNVRGAWKPLAEGQTLADISALIAADPSRLAERVRKVDSLLPAPARPLVALTAREAYTPVSAPVKAGVALVLLWRGQPNVLQCLAPFLSRGAPVIADVLIANVSVPLLRLPPTLAAQVGVLLGARVAVCESAARQPVGALLGSPLLAKRPITVVTDTLGLWVAGALEAALRPDAPASQVFLSRAVSSDLVAPLPAAWPAGVSIPEGPYRPFALVLRGGAALPPWPARLLQVPSWCWELFLHGVVLQGLANGVTVGGYGAADMVPGRFVHLADQLAHERARCLVEPVRESA